MAMAIAIDKAMDRRVYDNIKKKQEQQQQKKKQNENETETETEKKQETALIAEHKNTFK